MTVDQLYEKKVKEAGLYGKAFFGHKKSKKESRKLRSFYDQAKREVNARREFLNNLGKTNEAEEQVSSE